MTQDDEPRQETVDMFAYFAALSAVSDRFVVSKALQLIRGAAEARALAALLAEATVAKTAQDLQRSEAQLADLCVARHAHGVLMSDDGAHFTLHTAWAMLVRPGGNVGGEPAVVAARWGAMVARRRSDRSARRPAILGRTRNRAGPGHPRFMGCPHREPDELGAELEHAGFVDVYVLDRPG